MKPLFVIGIVILVVGVASLFIAIPQRQRHGVEAGGLSIGVETVDRQKVHPAISAVLIGGGVALMIAGKGRGQR
ncbi:MAG: hypothetical protein ABIP63_03350 [Thermoanaerobaculia bacterium]